MPNKSDLQMELTKVITQYDVNSTAPYVHLQKNLINYISRPDLRIFMGFRPLHSKFQNLPKPRKIYI